MESNEEALLLELESKNQEEYELKKKLSLDAATEMELEELEEKMITEVEQIKEKKLEALKQVQHLENALTALNSDGTEKIEQNNELITSLGSQKLQLEIKIAQNKLNEEEINEVRLNNQAASKDQQETLLNEINAQIETLCRKNDLDLHEKMELEEILEVRQYNYEQQLKELSEVKDNIQRLRDEIRIHKVSIEVLKGLPTDPSKQGNSMFAEVQDNCEGLKQKLKKLESQCLVLEVDSNDLTEKIQTAQKECENLLKEMDTISDHCDDANVDEIVAYEKEIEQLDKAIESFHEYPINNISIARNGLPDYAVEYAQECFKYHYWKGTIKMFNHLQRTYEEHFEISKQLRIKNFELRKLKREVLQLRASVQNFEIENPEIVKEETQVLNNSDNCESNKENYSVNANSRNINSTKVTIRKVSNPKITPPCRFSNNPKLANTEETEKSRLIEDDVELTRYSPLSEQKSKNDSVENEKTPKSSPSSDSDLQNIEERCKTDALKDYYMLTPVSPQSFFEDF